MNSLLKPEVTDNTLPGGQRPLTTAERLDEEYLIEKLKQEIVAYLIERELLSLLDRSGETDHFRTGKTAKVKFRRENAGHV